MTVIARRTTSPVADMIDWLESGTGLGLRGMGFAPLPRLEEFRDGDTYVVRAELPGIDPDKDVELSIVDDMLTITGERHEEKKEKNRQEFHYGSFSRSIMVPKGTDPDQVTATYDAGVLEVRFPATATETTARKIPVQHPQS